jgi:hypothetical protein
MKSRDTLLGLVVSLFISVAIFGQPIPETINYQGVLKDDAGIVVTDGDYNLTFKLYDVASSGSALWTETKLIGVADGIINTQLGSVTPITLPFDVEYWLGVTVEAESEMTPRVKLSSVPYSYMSMNVPDATITAVKIADDQVVKSINGLKDSVVLVAGSNISITPSGNDVIISSSVTGDNWGSQTVVSDATLSGEGTAALPLKLSQQGAASGQVLKWSGSTWQPGNDLTGTSLWQLNGSNAYYSDGWVGIGTSSVVNPLTIFNANNTCYINLSDNLGSMRMGSYIGELALINDNLNKNMRFTVNTSGGLKQLMTLAASTQRVGINTTTPPYTLSVLGGDISIHTDATGVTAYDGLRIGISGSNAWVWNYENGELYFGTNNQQRMTILNNGNVGINKSSPVHTLDIGGDLNLNSGIASGQALSVNSAEALWYNGTYFSWGYGGSFNYFGDRIAIGTTSPSATTMFTAVNTNGNYGHIATYYDGVVGYSNVSAGYAIYGIKGANASRAGYFSGDVAIAGNLSKSGGSFKIDHPLDPTNKNLYHSFVESPDMMNIYNGNVTTDGSGYATVSLPNWFDALNKDFRYQLTVLGDFAQAIVSQKIQNNQFTIRTDKPNIEVSWLVTGIRKDPWAEKNRIPVEESKPKEQIGKYLHPEVYGMPESMGVDYERIQKIVEGK